MKSCRDVILPCAAPVSKVIVALSSSFGTSQAWRARFDIFHRKNCHLFFETDGVATDGVSVSNFEILGDNGYYSFQFATL